MDKKVWTNRWICDPEFANLVPLQVLHRHLDTEFVMPFHKEELKNIHTLFRKCISLEKKPEHAYLDITADDYYKLYINGVYVTQGPAQSYPFAYYYNRIDVTEYIQEGENVIAVHVYYQGMINRAYNSGDYRQGMIAELWADGKLLTDDVWKCKRTDEYGTGNYIGYFTQYEENIDNRKKINGWREKNFDDSLWENAVPKKEHDYQLILQPTENLQIEDRYPVSITQTADGYIMDFGQELTGMFYMKAIGDAGAKIRLLCGEELNEDGSVRSQMRCNCVYEEDWTLDNGENILEQFEYKCFRYVQLIVEAGIKCSDFKVLYRHYPFDENVCQCPSDDELVKNIWEICKNAVKNCAQEMFMDCPHREKGQYLGDQLIEAHSFYYLTKDASLFKKALRDFANSTRICKGMMTVAPGNLMQEIADNSLMFPLQVLLYYRFTEDKAFLKEMLPIVEGIESFFDAHQNAVGLIENVKTKHNIVDWPANLRDDYDFDVSGVVVGDGCHNVINAQYIGMKLCLEKMKDILEIPYQNQTDALRRSFIDAFYCEETGLFVDSTVSTHSSLHANAYSFYWGLEPQGNRIVEFIRKKGFNCGVLVAYYILYGLLRTGNKDLAYELITNKSEHSWYNMLQEGATTAYEAWGKEQKWNTSLCHGWASAPIPVLVDMEDEDWKWII